MSDGTKPYVVRAVPAASDRLPRYSRPVLLGLRFVREAAEEYGKLTRQERREFANALYVTAAYIDLQVQMDAVDE
jgi:hypothetical protein